MGAPNGRGGGRPARHRPVGDVGGLHGEEPEALIYPWRDEPFLGEAPLRQEHAKVARGPPPARCPWAGK
eukprot:12898142-Alexandrium_andersonii.AAC.1